jgi:hypothetical protein
MWTGVWVPVEKGLPEKSGYYLVSTNERERAVYCTWWFSSDSVDQYGNPFKTNEWSTTRSVTAWMHLPPPYQG